MTKFFRPVLSLALVGATGLLLVADSAPECEEIPESVTFVVTGTCGEGEITYNSDTCGEYRSSGASDSVSDALQSPVRKDFLAESGGIGDGNFTTSGTIEGQTTECEVTKAGEALAVKCTHFETAEASSDTTEVVDCEATLTEK